MTPQFKLREFCLYLLVTGEPTTSAELVSCYTNFELVLLMYNVSYQTPALKKQGQGPICEDIFFGITWAEDVKSRLKLRNACCYSVQNLLSSSLLSIKIKIYKTVILPLVLYGCETWFLTMRVAQDEGFRE